MHHQMARILTILLTILLLSLSTKGQNNYVETLKGKVKLITSMTYLAETFGGVPTDTLTTKTRFLYDEKGNLIETNYYDIKTDVVYSKSRCVYDNNGNKLELTSYNKVGEIDGKNVYKYDNKNHEIEEKSTYWKNNNLNGKIIHNYDYKSMILETSFFKADGSLKYKFVYKIDDRGNIIEVYNSIGKIETKTQYQYNEKGKIIKKSWESYKGGGTQKGEIIYQYDEEGNEIKRVESSIYGKIISTSQYVYDNFGNWTKCVNLFFTTRTTTKREIEYY